MAEEKQVVKRNLLVTGGMGFIGSHTIVEILMTEDQCGFDKIVIIDNLCNSSVQTMQRILTITGKTKESLVFVECDIRDEAKMTEVFQTYGPLTSCIHFAGLKAVGESVSKPLEYYENNVGGSVALLKVMQKFDCHDIVFSSSATVYGDKPVANEEDTIQPTNPYGTTKAQIEVILKDQANAQKKMSTVCLRYFNPVGAHITGMIGEDPEGIPNNLMPYIQRIAGGHLPHLNVLGNDYPTPDGTGVRDFIHVTDLAKGHIAALRKQANEGLRGWHSFNLGTGRGTSVLELVAAYEEASGIKIEVKIAPRREGDVAQLLCIPDKANQQLEWEATLTVKEMCRDSINFVKKNPHGLR